MGYFSSRKRKKRLNHLENEILAYYSDGSKLPEDCEEPIEYIRQNGLDVFPYSFKNKYLPENIKVLKDVNCNLNYIIYEGKKLYHHKSKKIRKTQYYFNALYIEQDIQSPHRYLTNSFDVNEGDIVVDIGAAEGNFALSVIEKVKKIYLFETEEKWIKPLELTFAPWKEKVHIIKKFVSNKNDDKTISLDSFFKEDIKLDFIKMDIEGAEAKALEGCKEIMKNNEQLKFAICTYHRQNDYNEFSSLMENKGFQVSNSPGYMVFYDDIEIKAPYLRRGVLRAFKQ